MLAPIREALGKTEQQIQRIEKERAETFGSLKSSLESVALGQQALQKETRTLVNALRRPEVRGQWGEMTLRRLAELAGMVEHCDFNEQVHVRAEDGNLRPDMIVHMPDGRDLVVDVKTPLDAYLEAVDAATDEAACRSRCAVMRNAVAERVRQLGAKSYWSQFEQQPGLRHPVHSRRSVPVGGAGRAAEPAGRRDPPGRDHRDAVELRRAAEGRRVRLAADGAGAERRDHPHARRGSVQAPRRVHESSRASSAATWAAASIISTAPSARSNGRCCPARASSPNSACARTARSKRWSRSTSWRASRSGARTTSSPLPGTGETGHAAQLSRRSTCRRLDDSLINRAAPPGSMRYFSLLYSPEDRREIVLRAVCHRRGDP